MAARSGRPRAWLAGVGLVALAVGAVARKGLEVDKGSPLAPLGHYVLADVYNRRGKAAEANDAVAKARRIQAARRPAPAAG